jgi:hypothetical protein
VYLSESFDAAELNGLNLSHTSNGTDRSGIRTSGNGIGEDSPLSERRQSRREKTYLDFRGLDELSNTSPFTPRARSLSNSQQPPPSTLPPAPPSDSEDHHLKHSISHVESVGLSSIAIHPDDSH